MNKGGRGNRFIPTQEQREQVEKMAACGLTQIQIGLIIGCSDRQVRRAFEDEWHRGKARGVHEVTETLFRMARSGRCPSATYFYLKTQARWRETGEPISNILAGGLMEQLQKNIQAMTPQQVLETAMRLAAASGAWVKAAELAERSLRLANGNGHGNGHDGDTDGTDLPDDQLAARIADLEERARAALSSEARSLAERMPEEPDRVVN